MGGGRRWGAGVAAVGLGAALAWALVHFGGTESGTPEELFLVLLVPAVAGIAGFGLAARSWPLLLVGVVLLAATALLPSLEARGWLHAALGWLVLTLALGVGDKSRRLGRWLYFLLILAGALEALYGLVQAIGGVDYIGEYFRGSGRIATGTLINRNHFAGLLNLILPLTVGGLYASLSRGRRARGRRSELYARSWIILLGASFLGLAIVLSQSRGGVVSLVLTLAFLALLLSRRRRRGRGRDPSGLAILVLVATVGGLGLAFGIDALLHRIGMIDVAGRPAVYRATLELIRDHPLGGVGPGSYRWSFRPYQRSHPEVRFDHAHNDYLETAAEWGIPAALLFWGFVGRRLGRATGTVFRSRDPWRRGMALGCAGAIFSLVVHSLVDFNLQIPSNLMVFCLILGLSWSLEKGPLRSPLMARGEASVDPKGPSDPPQPEGQGGRGSAAAMVVRVVLAVVLLAAGWQVRQRLVALRTAQAEPTIAGLEAAQRRDPTEPRYAFRLGLVYRDALAARDLATARRHLERAVELNPRSWQYRLELARLYELTGETERAEKALLAAVAMNPLSGTYRWRLAHFYLRTGATDEVLPQVEAAIDRDRSLLEACLDLLLRIGTSDEEILRLWPRDREATRRMVALLVARRSREGEAPRDELLAGQWQRWLADPEPPAVGEGAFFVRHLLAAGRVAEARRQWSVLGRTNGIADPAWEDERNLIWNGDFELPLAGDPLGWVVDRGRGFAVVRAEGEGIDGGTALRIDFAGGENLDFKAVRQQVLVTPGRTHELSFRARSRAITSDEGPFFEVLAAGGGRSVLATTAVLETTPWRRYAVTFRAPEASPTVTVRLRRRPSRRIAGQLGGSLWLDAVRVTALSAEGGAP